MADSFRDILFPPGLAYGFRGGPMFNTTVLELSSGVEQRNVNWSRVRAKYDISHLMKKPDTYKELLAFFYAMQGRAYSFKFQDNFDDTISVQSIGKGTGAKTAFQIYKRYSITNGVDVFYYDRPITKLQGNPTGVTVNGVAKALTTDYTVNLNTGVVTFLSAPANNADVAIAEVKFYVQVRFDSDELDAEYSNWEAISWGSILLLEIKETAVI